MDTKNLISLRTFCMHYEIEESFVYTLNEYGIFQVKTKKQQPYLRHKDLPLLEKMIRLHKDLDINPEGIQAVYQLMKQVEELQLQVQQLKSKLNAFNTF